MKIPNKTDVSVKYITELIDDVHGNYFSNIPPDLKCFIHNNDSLLKGIVENLEPSQSYEIEIKIKSV